MCLHWRADLRPQPSWQLSAIQDARKTWLATGSILTVWWGMPLAFSLWLSLSRLPLCLWWVEGLVCSRPALLCFSLNPLFCEWGKVLSLFFLSLAILQFGFLSHVSSLRLSSGHSSLVLTLSIQAMPPCPAPLAGGGGKRLDYYSTGSCG